MTAVEKVVDLSKKRACSECGHEPGGHETECTRSSANMRRITDIRLEKIRKGEIVAKGGRPRKLRITRQELDELAKQSAGEMLYGDRATAVALLRKQMGSKDERVAQKAALEILAYTDGKPTQKIESSNETTTEVVYRTAALAPTSFTPEAIDDVA